MALNRGLLAQGEAPSPARRQAAKPRIVIIGGGFSGAAFATLLMRDQNLSICDITIVEPREVLGAGIAYSAKDPQHRVNIAAPRMAALPDEVEDFDAWLKLDGRIDGDQAAFYPDRGLFPARALFGLYIDDLLRKTSAASPRIGFKHIGSRVEMAAGTPAGYRLKCASGESIEADILVLCTGHPSPRLPWPLSSLPAHPGLIVNPWGPNAVEPVQPDEKVLIVGTGLTMGDMIASLRQQGHRAPLTAISRHGLTPRPRGGAIDPIEELSFTGAGGVSKTLQIIRREVRRAEAAGKSWSDVFDRLRMQNSAIWTHWSEAEQRRFRRHLRAYWDVHRFQAAPQIHDLVAEELASNQLTIFAAAMTKAAIDGAKIGVTLRQRGRAETETHSFDVIINCTGATGALIDDNDVLKSLANEGHIRPDCFGSGIDVDGFSRARTTAGQPNENLFVLGPAIRGCLGEISGALEIATHAQHVAHVVATRLKEKQRAT